MEFFSALGILMLVVGAGWSGRKFSILSKEQTLGISSFIYYFALPALFFVKIAEIDLYTVDVTIFLGSVLPIFFLFFILLALKFVRILSKDVFVLLALSIIFGSNAFFGITFFEAFRGEAGLDFAVLSSSILGPIGIVLSIFIFEYADKRSQGWCACKKIFSNPLIISIIAGLLFSLLYLRLGFLFDALDMLGKTAGPLAIFVLGAFVYDNFSFRTFKASVPYALFRLIALPAAAFLVVYLLSPEKQTGEFLLLQSGVPAAIALAVFAKRYEYQIGKISDMVVLTSVGSFFVLGVIYLLMN
jgi:malonate transporter